MDILLERSGISDHHKTPSGSGEGDIQSTPIAQESHHSVLITSHSRENDNLLFTSLVSINTADIDIGCDFGWEVLLELLLDQSHLTTVWRDNSNLAGLKTERMRIA
eukprot:TRINITY_DN9346_c0_g1_i1.p1 TRINITY_DN9346_c0_g1~~TRINITY_DN9346_c0_g1_i1.p1  ORF type:complete len:106 (-),score=19.26 TRINITY_DN9346_c0_g1_i1:4-321(-)